MPRKGSSKTTHVGNRSYRVISLKSGGTKTVTRTKGQGKWSRCGGSEVGKTRKK